LAIASGQCHLWFQSTLAERSLMNGARGRILLLLIAGYLLYVARDYIASGHLPPQEGFQLDAARVQPG
jgi:hypothetical protein